MGYDELGMIVRLFLPGADLPAIPGKATTLVQKLATTFPIPGESLEQLKQSGRWARV
jgi:hypothetical protein